MKKADSGKAYQLTRSDVDQHPASYAAYAAMTVVIDDTGLLQPAIAFGGLLVGYK